MQAAKQLGSEVAKRNCHCEAKSFKGIVKIFENPLSQSHSIKKLASFVSIRESVKLFSLTKRKFFIFSPLGGRLEFVSELERTYKFKRGVKRYKNTDRATECAMTNVVKNLLKITVGWAFQPNNKTFLISPLEGEKKFLSEFYELRNFREGVGSPRLTQIAEQSPR